jgi:hypothetical protein
MQCFYLHVFLMITCTLPLFFLDLSEKNERASFISIPGLIWRNAEFVNTG